MKLAIKSKMRSALSDSSNPNTLTRKSLVSRRKRV